MRVLQPLKKTRIYKIAIKCLVLQQICSFIQIIMVNYITWFYFQLLHLWASSNH